MTELVDNAAWPMNIIMVSIKHRMLFTPIAKNAGTSLKRLFVRVSGHPETNAILQQEIHTSLVNGHTGLVLEDYSRQEATEILNDDRYYRFTVLRNPVERAVSGYINKFVVSPPPRGPDGVPRHTADVIAWVYARRGEKPDYDRAITFAEFVDCLSETNDEDLDTHFKSQQAFLSGQVFDELFRVEKMKSLKTALEGKLGQRVHLEHTNRRIKRRLSWKRTEFGHLLPHQLKKYRSLPDTHTFVAPEIAEKLEHRFQADIELWNSAG